MARVIQAYFAPRAGIVQARAGATPLDLSRLDLGGGTGRPLPDALRAKMEAFFRADFSDVRIHHGPQAQAIGAHAFTMGSGIWFAPGQYAPDTRHGQQLIGHELTHVLQQRSGRVRAHGSGVSVVNDPALEAEADRMGALAAGSRAPVQAKAAHPTSAPKGPAVQAKASTQSGHRLVVGAYLHQGKGSLPAEMAGHAFVALEGPNGKREAWGFSPANYSRYDPNKDLGRLRAGVPGKLHRDEQAFSRPGVRTQAIDLSPDEARAAQLTIARYKTGAFRFSAQSRQCTTFVGDVLRAVGKPGAATAGRPGELYRRVGSLQLKAASMTLARGLPPLPAPALPPRHAAPGLALQARLAAGPGRAVVQRSKLPNAIAYSSLSQSYTLEQLEEANNERIANQGGRGGNAYSGHLSGKSGDAESGQTEKVNQQMVTILHKNKEKAKAAKKKPTVYHQAPKSGNDKVSEKADTLFKEALAIVLKDWESRWDKIGEKQVEFEGYCTRRKQVGDLTDDDIAIGRQYWAGLRAGYDDPDEGTDPEAAI
jgi:hypothetical protein